MEQEEIGFNEPCLDVDDLRIIESIIDHADDRNLEISTIWVSDLAQFLI